MGRRTVLDGNGSSRHGEISLLSRETYELFVDERRVPIVLSLGHSCCQGRSPACLPACYPIRLRVAQNNSSRSIIARTNGSADRTDDRSNGRVSGLTD